MNQPTTLGSILVAMGACTVEDVQRAAEEQAASDEGKQIGIFLLARGHITEQELDAALEAQGGLRSTKRHLRALAQADIAMHSGSSTRELAQQVRQKSEEVKRATTGSGHPAVTANMLRPSESKE